MRKTGMGVVALLSLGIGSAAMADVFRTRVSGTAAIANFHDVSNDGCVETTGQLVALSGTTDTFAIAVAERWDYCAVDGPAGEFFAGGGSATFAGNGLSSASASGTVVADEYTGRGLPPLTIEFDLAFAGTGGVSATSSHFSSGGGGATVAFQSTRTRSATATGSLTLDGDAASVTSAQLYAEVAGELVVVQ